ncbi:MAG: hypothetical protein NTZ79_18770 [Proteobacteria bacterium]|nr:hypothetical protein [Pseudomonadota bacterium]
MTGSAQLSGRALILRWCACGLLLPATLGGLSWIAYTLQIAIVSELLSMPALFSAPLSPFAVAAMTAHGAQGPWPYVIAGNVVIYGLLGLLHQRLQARPRVDQSLWLALTIGVGFAVLSFAASILAFA